ncbi:unnamed protein product, partial [Musa acuminata var. zebrina]
GVSSKNTLCCRLRSLHADLTTRHCAAGVARCSSFTYLMVKRFVILRFLGAKAAESRQTHAPVS